MQGGVDRLPVSTLSHLKMQSQVEKDETRCSIPRFIEIDGSLIKQLLERGYRRGEVFTRTYQIFSERRDKVFIDLNTGWLLNSLSSVQMYWAQIRSNCNSLTIAGYTSSISSLIPAEN